MNWEYNLHCSQKHNGGLFSNKSHLVTIDITSNWGNRLKIRTTKYAVFIQGLEQQCKISQRWTKSDFLPSYSLLLKHRMFEGPTISVHFYMPTDYNCAFESLQAVKRTNKIKCKIAKTSILKDHKPEQNKAYGFAGCWIRTWNTA